MREKDKDEFARLPWRAHSLLAGVPLRSLYRIELPGGRASMTLADIAAITGFGGDAEMGAGRLTKALFDLRGFIGRLFDWDEAPALVEAVTYLKRLSVADYESSQVKPGTAMGISRVLYRFEHEMLAEIINRTVHCFWLLAATPTDTGYALYMAVYVKKLNWFTPIYMTLITPVVKGIIYPAMLERARQRWLQAFPPLREKAQPAGVH